MRIVFFNISYMNFYMGKENDEMVGSFRYVKEKGDGGEKHNFAPLLVDGKEVLYGFVEPGFTKGGFEKGRQRQMCIQKIKDAGNPGEKVDNVLVIWCAKLPKTNRSIIVGWYKNATVYRSLNLLPYQEDTDRGLLEFGYWYNVVADKTDCVLLPIEERKKDKWIAYRKKQNPNNFGFGQSNMWYAREESAQEYVSNIIMQVEEYNADS
ncbi:MAG: hypothetical protein GX913_00995 [Clostridiales bacterium]|nr:hypothetical protein [Clostridiales bacterium]